MDSCGAKLHVHNWSGLENFRILTKKAPNFPFGLDIKTISETRHLQVNETFPRATEPALDPTKSKISKILVCSPRLSWKSVIHFCAGLSFAFKIELQDFLESEVEAESKTYQT